MPKATLSRREIQRFAVEWADRMIRRRYAVEEDPQYVIEELDRRPVVLTERMRRELLQDLAGFQPGAGRRPEIVEAVTDIVAAELDERLTVRWPSAAPQPAYIDHSMLPGPPVEGCVRGWAVPCIVDGRAYQVTFAVPRKPGEAPPADTGELLARGRIEDAMWIGSVGYSWMPE